jgi:hypothetical protein
MKMMMSTLDIDLEYQKEAVVVVIVWQLDLQLPVQSVPIITKVVSSNPAYGEVYLIQHFVIKFVSDWQQMSGFLRVLQFPPPIKLTATVHDGSHYVLDITISLVILSDISEELFSLCSKLDVYNTLLMSIKYLILINVTKLTYSSFLHQ